MRYCIVTIVDGKITSYYKEISTDVSKIFSVRNISERIPCHITLKYPFEGNAKLYKYIDDTLQ
jgi:2'-5' RNA ligase